jgi:RNA polymerase sigma factor (sigma-70 family)
MSALFRAQAGDFDRLYREHAPSVYRYAFAVLGNQADAEDVTQQTFLNAYRAVERGTKPRKAENWLLRIAHNEVRRHFRKNGAAVEVEFDDRLGVVARDDSDPRLADVLRALRKLPPNQRAALVMREFEGRPYSEIAEVLEISQSALEALLFRARRGLAEELDDAFTCPDAEHALSRSLDGRLPRRESRRLKEHLHECVSCVRFATLQKRQRSLLKGLSVMPIPASLFLVRSEHAAAAGLGGAATGSGAVAAGGAATGIAAKAAAVAATAVVAGGAGYGVATQVAPPSKAPPKRARVAVVPVTRQPARVAQIAAPGRKVVAAAKLRAPATRAPKPSSRRPSARQPRASERRRTLVHVREHAKVVIRRAKVKPVRVARPERLQPVRGKRLGAARRRARQPRPAGRQPSREKIKESPKHPDPVPPGPKNKE